MSHRTRYPQQGYDSPGSSSPVSNHVNGERRLGRKSWRTMGIRLNTEMTLQNVHITNIHLGSGSFGAVDVRVAEWCSTKVAAKTLIPPQGDCPASPGESSLDFGRNTTPYQKRVLQECNLMGRLCHPHIAQLHGVFIDAEGRPVIVTELLAASLSQRFAFGPRLTFRDVMDSSVEVLSALSYLHSLPHPVVHGSLCSSNVMLTTAGNVKLTDTNLALARLHTPNTPTSSSPQLRARDDSGVSNHACAQHSAVAKLYLPLDMQVQDCYDTSVDCFSFIILLIAMCLHHEPRVSTNITDGSSALRRSELTRRQEDLAELHLAAPLIEPLVAVYLDDGAVIDRGSRDSPRGSRDSPRSATLSCPSAFELMKNIQEIRCSDEYRKWPFTLGSPLVHASRQQAELEGAVRLLQQQVVQVVDATKLAMEQQEEHLSQQIKEMASVHSAQVARLRKRLSEARTRVQQAHVAEAQERSERRAAEAARDSLAKTLEALRANSGSPQSLAATGRHTHSDMDAADEASTDGGDLTSPLKPNGHDHLGLGAGATDEPDGSVDYSEPLTEVSVQVPNEGVKLVSVDESVTVDEIIQSLCEVNGLSDPEGYCMHLDEDDAPIGMVKRNPPKPQKSFRGKRFDLLKRKSPTSDPETSSRSVVLNGDYTLDQQGVHPNAQLLLLMRRRSDNDIRQVKSVNHDEEIEEDLEMDFSNFKEALACGSLLCTVEEASNLLAFYAQAMYGDHANHNKDLLKCIAEAMKEAVVGVSLKSKHLKKLMTKYSQLPGMSMVYAKVRYVQMCKGLATYNTSIFQVKERTKKDKGKVCVLAVGPRRLYKLDDKTKEVAEIWLVKNIFRACATGELLTIEATGKPSPLILSSSAAAEIAKLISRYTKKIMDTEQSSSSGPPLLTVTEATPRHSPLRHTLSNNTIIPSSPKSGSPRVIQRLAIRRTESATVIRKLSPSTSINRGTNHPTSVSLTRLRSQSASSVTKPPSAAIASSKFHSTHHDPDTDSSEEHLPLVVASSMPNYTGGGKILASSDPDLATCPLHEI